jgi:hypothetical protein
MPKAISADEAFDLVQLIVFGNPPIRQVLKATGFCGENRAVIQPACGRDIGQVLKAKGSSGSGGCPIRGLSVVGGSFFFEFFFF